MRYFIRPFYVAPLYLLLLKANGLVGQASSDRNFVIQSDIRKPGIISQAQVNALTVEEKSQSIVYFDGLGRPIQKISIQANPDKNDLVTPVEYDDYGREIKQYLPYANIAGGAYGSLRTAAYAEQNNFYSSANTSVTVQKDVNPYTQTLIEFSPLNRLTEQGSAGQTWQPGANHSILTNFSFNAAADVVKIWTIVNTAGSIPASTALYATNDLFKTITSDERGKQVIEYKDREGKVILKKVQLADVPGIDHTGWLCTYYVYDDYNNLRFVIPPKAVELFLSGNALSVLADELCFRYEYDERQRMVIKKVPGAGEVYMIYDQRDRLVFTQDAKMRAANQWLTTLYDGLNRPSMTGMITYTGTRSALQSYVNANTGAGARAVLTTSLPAVADAYVAEREAGKTLYTATGSISFVGEFGSETGAEFTVSMGGTAATENTPITDNPLPPGNNLIALTYHYYDDYAWTSRTYDISNINKLSAGVNLNPETLPVTASAQKLANTRGLVTGSRVRVIENPANLAVGIFLASTSFYDAKARVIQTQADNYNGSSLVTTQLYDFAGKVLSSFIAQNNPAANDRTGVRTDMEYDHADRVKAIKKSVYTNYTDASPIVTSNIAKNEYDELGQLKRKTLSPDYNNNQGLEKQDFEYNIRGWLLGMNRDYTRDANNNNYFGFDLGYDKTNNNLIGGQQYAAAQYNGNITGTVWKSKGDQEKRKYDFTYDAANRLTGADFNQYTSSTFNRTAGFDFSVSNLSYDANGNILTMNQAGWKPGGSSNIDELTYTYIPNSNKLLNVKDKNNFPSTTLGDFRTSALHPQAAAKQAATTAAALAAITDYSYDVNGNLLKDLNKDIGNAGTNGITYNHLNLPWQVLFKNATGDKGTITYIYDAAGNKLKKVTVENAPAINNNTAKTTTTVYINGFVFENDQLQFIGHEEGRIRIVVIPAAPTTPCPDPPLNPPPGFDPAPCSPAINVGLTYCAFDYFVKDHLGNIRALLTDEEKIDHYPTATLEGSALAKEKNYYDITDAYVVAKPTGTSPATLLDYLNDNGTNNPNTFADKNLASQKMYKLNAATNRIGMTKMLKVMAGDKVSILAKSYYRYAGGSVTNMPFSATDLINGFLAVAGGINPATQHGATTAILNADPALLTPLNSFTNSNLANGGNNVKAAVNYIILDEHFKYVSGGFDPVQSDAAGGLKPHFLQDVPIPKNGYIYIYCSNESNIDVFFDNLEVVHTRGPLLEETQYYPFGLQIAGISPKSLSFGGSENKCKFNAGSELQSKEFSDRSGLELYDAKYRLYDPQVGRFMQIDPLSDFSWNMGGYTFASNNPISRNDPWGLKDTVVNGQVVQRDKDLKEVVVTPKKPSSSLHFTNGFFRALDNYSHEERMQDEVEYTEFDKGQLDKVSAVNKKIFTQWKVAEQESHTLSLTLVGSMVAPIVISAIPVASISAGYTTLSTQALDASLIVHLETNLALNALRLKALERVIGGSVAIFGKNALYSRILWKISEQGSTPSSPINGQTLENIIIIVMGKFDEYPANPQRLRP